eukprot:jgi/Mesvir1/5450/Mv15507-RA.1
MGCGRLQDGTAVGRRLGDGFRGLTQHTPPSVDNALVNVEDDSDEVVMRPEDTAFMLGVPPAATPREAVIPPLAQTPAPARAAPAPTPCSLLRGTAGAGPSRPSLGVSSAFASGCLGRHNHNHKKHKREPAHTPSAVGCSCECCPHSVHEAEYQLGACQRKLAKTTAELSKTRRIISAARVCCVVCSEPFNSEKGKYPVLFHRSEGVTPAARGSATCAPTGCWRPRRLVRSATSR